ncbi:hypothetical protein AMTRI_Chr11g93800 [Amborella trichopoda]
MGDQVEGKMVILLLTLTLLVGSVCGDDPELGSPPPPNARPRLRPLPHPFLSPPAPRCQPPPLPPPKPKPPPQPKPPPHPQPPPPPKPKPKPRKAICKLKEFPLCYLSVHTCPNECPERCAVDCAACKPVCICNMPGAVCQDPRFVGGDGVTFYFHGKKDHDFCLSTAILFGPHHLFIGAQKVAKWDDSLDHLSVTFDGHLVHLPLSEGSEWRGQACHNLTLTRTSRTNGVVAELIGKFKITANVVPITMEESMIHGYNITDEDCFAHLDLGFKFYGLSGNVSGVLGQTYREGYRTRVRMGAAMPIMGGDSEFATTNLFAADCAVARFESGNATGGDIWAEDHE